MASLVLGRVTKAGAAFILCTKYVMLYCIVPPYIPGMSNFGCPPPDEHTLLVRRFMRKRHLNNRAVFHPSQSSAICII